MSDFSSIHAADLYLGAPFRGLAPTGSARAGLSGGLHNRLLQAIAAAWGRLAEFCLGERPLTLPLSMLEQRYERGEALPLILGDTLVNSDSTCLARSAGAILSLAQKHQIFYFTCQPHLAPQIMERAGQKGISARCFALDRGMMLSA